MGEQRNRVPEQLDHRSDLGVADRAIGAPWPNEYIDVVRRAAELRVPSRTVFSIAAVFGVALAATAVTLVGGERSGSSVLLVLSFASTALALVGAILGYHSAQTAKRVENSLASEVSQRLRAHEIESLILVRALEVFGDSERAIEWMRDSNPSLNSAPPIRMIQTEEGRREVLHMLGRIQRGVIS